MLADTRSAAGDDDDWIEYDRFVPVQVVTSPSASATWLYLTKLPVFVRMMGEANIPSSTAMLGRYGIPSPDTIDLVRRLVGADRPIRFFGDLDPLDITVCLLLMDALPVSHIGLNGAFLCAADKSNPGVVDRVCIMMNKFEKEHWDRLKHVGVDLEAMIGPDAVSLLDSGKKVEIEAVVDHSRFGASYLAELRHLLQW